ncbi:tetratricopeptide repeat protein [Chitinivorax sp. PXF-14]|uniref:O-linked N-acetylglucosamine transferase, SPINDLY family protein n=1 Tax=Chitinivorax sp. PXF-14 TaxID=3230488 RepID=UPI0034672FDE
MPAHNVEGHDVNILIPLQPWQNGRQSNTLSLFDMTEPVSPIFGKIVAALKERRLSDAAVLATQAHMTQPDDPLSAYYMAVVAARMNKHRSAHEYLDDNLRRHPEHAPSLLERARVFCRQGRAEQALEPFAAAAALVPADMAIRRDWGIALATLGNWQDALPHLQQAAKTLKQDVELHRALGLALCMTGNARKGLAAFEQAIPGKRSDPAWHVELARIFLRAGRLDDAWRAASNALEIDARSLPALEAAWNIALDRQDTKSAIAMAERAVKLSPNANTYQALAVALADGIDPEQACAEFERALAFDPTNLQVLSSYSHHSMYVESLSPEQVFELHRRYGNALEQEVRPIQQPKRDLSPSRRLRIGYVSGDFRAHAFAKCALPLFRHHDHNQVEVFCYYTRRYADAATREFMALADTWRHVADLNDTQLAELIADDGIDVLIDCSLHTDGHRLPVFARKPAPVQAAWCGLQSTTGLSRIDYRLTDASLDPPGMTERYHSEMLWRLPQVTQVLDRPDHYPEPGPLPALAKGHVTFCVFNRLSKKGPSSLRFWAETLHGTPGSKLMVVALTRDGKPSGHSERLIRALAAHGIERDRLILERPRDWDGFLALHREVDIQLDTSPFAGLTTTAISVAMGVPMVTIAGALPSRRGSMMVLNAVGHPEWSGDDADAAARVATALAADLPRLAEIRASLPGRARISALHDGPAFARDMEQAYRAMWQRWLEHGTGTR